MFVEIASIDNDVAYPTVHLRIVNTNDEPVSVCKCILAVEGIVINRTPALAGFVEGTSGYRNNTGLNDVARFLKVIISNGAGLAAAAKVVLEHPFLDRLFPREARSFVLIIPPHGRAPLYLDADRMAQGSFQTLRGELEADDRRESTQHSEQGFAKWLERAKIRNRKAAEDETRRRYRTRDRSRPFFETMPADLDEAAEYQVFLTEREAALTRRWAPTCGIEFDTFGVRHETKTDEQSLRGYFEIDTRPASTVRVHEKGFAVVRNEVFWKIPELRECPIIDAGRGPHQKAYPMEALNVAARSQQALSLNLGASESGSYRLALSFVTDRGETLASRTFTVRVWSPSNERRIDLYRDGLGLSRS